MESWLQKTSGDSSGGTRRREGLGQLWEVLGELWEGLEEIWESSLINRTCGRYVKYV